MRLPNAKCIRNCALCDTIFSGNVNITNPTYYYIKFITFIDKKHETSR